MMDKGSESNEIKNPVAPASYDAMPALVSIPLIIHNPRMNHLILGQELHFSLPGAPVLCSVAILDLLNLLGFFVKSVDRNHTAGKTVQRWTILFQPKSKRVPACASCEEFVVFRSCKSHWLRTLAPPECEWLRNCWKDRHNGTRQDAVGQSMTCEVESCACFEENICCRPESPAKTNSLRHCFQLQLNPTRIMCSFAALESLASCNVVEWPLMHIYLDPR